MLSMNERIESFGGRALSLRYEEASTSVTINARDNSTNTIQLSIPAEQFDRMVEQYMYIRQFSNGRRAR